MSDLIVIKIGGGAGIELAPVLTEIAQLIRDGRRVVLVHGGSHETNNLAEQLGHPPRWITSPSGHTSRRTDRRTLEIFNMAYCGKVNKHIVESMRTMRVDAIGLSGLDAGIWTGQRKDTIRSIEDGRTIIIRDDLSGVVRGVDTAFLTMLLDAGRTPVLTPPAVTRDGMAINVDADRAAAATAGALGAGVLLLLSNVPGVLADPADPASLIASSDNAGIEAIRLVASGRMKNKVLAAEEAIQAGVPHVVIGSANGPHPVTHALAGRGTVIQGAPA